MLLKRPSRLWMAVGAAVLVSSVGAGTVWSYVRTAHAELGRSIRDTVPIAFELKRVEALTQDLIPEIRANQKVAAQLDVEIEYLQREIQAMRESQDEAKSQMKKLRQSLVDERGSYKFGGREFSRPEVEQDLARRLERYDNVSVQLAAKQRILTERRRTLAAASDKIRHYQQQRDLLVEKTASLEAELKLVELAQDTGSFEFNRSNLNQAKELAQEVEKRIRTLQKLIEGERHIPGEIPVEADARPVAQRYDEYFAESQTAAEPDGRHTGTGSADLFAN